MDAAAAAAVDPAFDAGDQIVVASSGRKYLAVKPLLRPEDVAYGTPVALLDVPSVEAWLVFEVEHR